MVAGLLNLGKIMFGSIFINLVFFQKNSFFKISKLGFKNRLTFKNLRGYILLKQNKLCLGKIIQPIIKPISQANDFNKDEHQKKVFQLRWDIISTVLVLFGIFEKEPKDSPLIVNIKKGLFLYFLKLSNKTFIF